LFRLAFEPHDKGLGAESEEKREPATDIDTAVVDSLKVLDPERPIREADIGKPHSYRRFTLFLCPSCRDAMP
jgi:hypothetical protein